MKKIILAAALLMSAIEAMTDSITVAGAVSGLHEVRRWSLSESAKTLDVAGNNVYGEDGYVWFGTDGTWSLGGSGDSVAASTSVTAVMGAATNYMNLPSYVIAITTCGDFAINGGPAGLAATVDNPVSAADAMTVGNLAFTTESGSYLNLLSMTLDPGTYRIGFATDFVNTGDAIEFNLYNVAMGSVPGSPAGRIAINGDPDIQFFDVEISVETTFTLAALNADGGAITGTLAGITFDTISEPINTEYWAETSGMAIKGNPSMTSWAEGQLHVVALGSDDTIKLRYYDGSSWQDWTTISDVVNGDPSLCSWARTNLHVAVRGEDGNVYLRYYDGSSWQAWDQIGGAVGGNPKLISRSEEVLDVFVRGGGDYLYQRSFAGSWSDWAIFSQFQIQGDPSLLSWADGKLHVAVLDTNGDIRLRYFDGTVWQPWQTLSHSEAVSAPVLGSSGEGHLVVLTKVGSQMEAMSYNGTWSGWSNLGGCVAGDPVVSGNGGEIYVCARGTDNTLHEIRWAGQWGNWKTGLTDTFVGNPAVTSTGIDYDYGLAVRRSSDDELLLARARDYIARYTVEGEYYKDFFLWYEAGTYHLFYNVGGGPDWYAWWIFPNENQFGHATSTDLLHWTRHANVIPTEYAWEDPVVTAPSIVKNGSTYYMVYGGFAENGNVQQTGFATSPDLFNWTKYTNNPVWHPPTSWCNWSGITWSNGRDSEVILHNGEYVMYTTATEASSGKSGIFVASSTNLINWTNHGFAYLDPVSLGQGNPENESPNVFYRDGHYYMFVGVDFKLLTSTDPKAINWTEIPFEHPYGNFYAHAAYYNGNQWILAAFTLKAEENEIRFWELGWDGTQPSIDYSNFRNNSESYARWAGENFTTEERANIVISDISADPDGDGVPNLLEYALGLIPTVADSSMNAQVELMNDQAAWVQTFNRYASRNDVNLYLQRTDSLLTGTWGDAVQSIGGAPVVATNGFHLLSVSNSEPETVQVASTNLGSQCFLRWKGVKP